MKLVTPYTGVVVDVPEPFVSRYKERGYTEPAKPKKTPKKKSEKKPEKE